VYSVRIAVVDGNTGKIKEWIVSDTEGEDGVESLPPSVNAAKSTTNLRIPGEGAFGESLPIYGVYGAMAATVTMTETDTTYLYLMGGVRQYIENDTGRTQIEPSREIYYARVGQDGRLYKPGTSGSSTNNVGWERLDDIPLPNDGEQEGLYYSSLISSESIFGYKALYLVGGETSGEGSQNTAVVYRALVNSDGTLTWQGINPETSASEITGTMPNPLSAHTAMELDNRIYVVGGIVYENQGEQRVAVPVRTGMLGYFRDDLELNDFNPGGEPLYFQVPAEDAPPREQALLDPRAYHASVIVDAGEGSQFLYVFGGVGVDQIDINGSDRVSVYRVRDDFSEAQDPSYASTGWFVSRPYALQQQDPRIEQMSWVVNFETGKGTMELQMQYRTAPQLNCENPLWSEWKPDSEDESAPWTSNNGFNEYDLEPETGVKCFQYRARFAASSSLKQSPQLREVGIKIFVPGGPDVHTDERREDDGFDVKWLNEDSSLLADFDGVDIYLTNHYANETEEEPTLNVDVATPDQGQFLADLFIIGPGYNERVVTPTLPLSSTQYITNDTVLSSTMYVMLNKADFPATDPPISYRVASDSWCVSSADLTAPCEQKDIRDMITQGGEYIFCVAVDSYVDDPAANPLGLINEVLDGAEDNNFRCSEPVTIEDKPIPPPTLTLESLGTTPGATTVVTEGETLNMLELSWEPTQNEPVTITLGLEGSAVAGSDYTVFMGDASNVVTDTLILPARENSVMLSVSAVHEGEIEGNETFTLSLLDGEDSYILSDNVSEQVTILDIDKLPTVYMPLIVR
jgi:hypothetical protein